MFKKNQTKRFWSSWLISPEAKRSLGMMRSMLLQTQRKPKTRDTAEKRKRRKEVLAVIYMKPLFVQTWKFNINLEKAILISLIHRPIRVFAKTFIVSHSFGSVFQLVPSRIVQLHPSFFFLQPAKSQFHNKLVGLYVQGKWLFPRYPQIKCNFSLTLLFIFSRHLGRDLFILFIWKDLFAALQKGLE